MKLFDEAKSGQVRDAVQALVGGWPGVEAKQMMGCPGWRASGALFASVIDDGVMLHTLTAEQRAEAKAKLGAGPFRPAPGRSMETWVVVLLKPAAVPKLEPWLRLCYEAALAKAKAKATDRGKSSKTGGKEKGKEKRAAKA